MEADILGMAPFVEIDFITVVLVAILNIGLGMIWYSKGFFGKKWAKLSGAKKPKDPGYVYSFSIFASLVTAFTLELFISNFPSANAWTGLMTGFWAGIGFFGATSIHGYLFSGDSEKNELFLINSGYHIVSLTIMGFILGI